MFMRPLSKHGNLNNPSSGFNVDFPRVSVPKCPLLYIARLLVSTLNVIGTISVG